MPIGTLEKIDSLALPAANPTDGSGRGATGATAWHNNAARRRALLGIDSEAHFRIGSGYTEPRRRFGGRALVLPRFPRNETIAKGPAPREPTASIRRALDVTIALAAAIFLSPLILLIGVAIALQRDGPVLFVQERVGHRGKPFACYKFRSMVPNAEARLAAILASSPALRAEWAEYRKLKRDPRNTLFGEFLRSTSLDELPQLYNILKGDMSLVGPRPILSSELALYGRWLSCYTSVRPGLTGLWQVSGRNLVSYRRRVAMDRFYARAFSIKLYVRILFATIPAVVFRRGSY
jgi:exopolysaccharide production protein ExoY